MSAHLALLPIVVGLAVGVLAWFYRLAKTGRHVTILCVIVGLIVVETALYETIDVPRGIFHLGVGSSQIRTIDIVIILALLANLAAGRTGLTLTTTSLLWVGFGVWIVAEAAVGDLNGNSKTYISYEAKTLIYLGLFSIARRVSLRDPRTRVALERLLYFTAAVAAVAVTLGAAGAPISLNVPGLHGAELGRIGSIGGTLFVTLGILALALAIASETRRLRMLVIVGPLFVPPLMATQRASLINLVVSVAAVLLLLPLARHRLRATLMEVFLALLVAGALVALPVFISGVIEAKRVVPFSHSLNKAISGGEKKLSAQDRVNQLVQARKAIAQRPLTGWGLGKTITYYEVGLREFKVTYLTHNIITDLLLRTGAVGLLLFFAALGSSFAQGVRAWRSAGDPLIAASALAACAIMAGWFAHGMVESLFEHVQLAPILGITAGLAQAAASQRRVPERPEPLLAPVVAAPTT
jgi:O-antigen ligase